MFVRVFVFFADVNECVERPTVCRANQECRNTVGSYTCHNLITCSAGYQLNAEGSRCEGGSRIPTFFKESVKLVSKAGSVTVCHSGTSMVGSKRCRHFLSVKHHTGMWYTANTDHSAYKCAITGILRCTRNRLSAWLHRDPLGEGGGLGSV